MPFPTKVEEVTALIAQVKELKNKCEIHYKNKAMGVPDTGLKIMDYSFKLNEFTGQLGIYPPDLEPEEKERVFKHFQGKLTESGVSKEGRFPIYLQLGFLFKELMECRELQKKILFTPAVIASSPSMLPSAEVKRAAIEAPKSTSVKHADRGEIKEIEEILHQVGILCIGKEYKQCYQKIASLERFKLDDELLVALFKIAKDYVNDIETGLLVHGGKFAKEESADAAIVAWLIFLKGYRDIALGQVPHVGISSLIANKVLNDYLEVEQNPKLQEYYRKTAPIIASWAKDVDECALLIDPDFGLTGIHQKIAQYPELLEDPRIKDIQRKIEEGTALIQEARVRSLLMKIEERLAKLDPRLAANGKPQASALGAARPAQLQAPSSSSTEGQATNGQHSSEVSEVKEKGAELFAKGLSLLLSSDKKAAGVRLIEMAAKQGYQEAQFRLGSLLFKGEQTPKNPTEALKWWRMAAESGHVKAQSNLGIVLESGREVAKDLVEADKWLRLAAQAGDEKAKQKLQKASAPAPIPTSSVSTNAVVVEQQPVSVPAPAL